MTEKAPRPFKSGVTDYEELYKRIKELGIHSPLKPDVGVDMNPQPVEPQPNDPGHYAYFKIGTVKAGEVVTEEALQDLFRNFFGAY